MLFILSYFIELDFFNVLIAVMMSVVFPAIICISFKMMASLLCAWRTKASVCDGYYDVSVVDWQAHFNVNSCYSIMIFNKSPILGGFYETVLRILLSLDLSCSFLCLFANFLCLFANFLCLFVLRIVLVIFFCTSERLDYGY